MTAANTTARAFLIIMPSVDFDACSTASKTGAKLDLSLLPFYFLEVAAADDDNWCCVHDIM